MRVLPAGPDAVLLDFSAAADPSGSVTAAKDALTAAIAGDHIDGVEELIPAASTLLIQVRTGTGVDLLGVHRALRASTHPAPTACDTAVRAPDSAEPHHVVADSEHEILIPVTYDGPDLDDVASALGIDTGRVIEIHRTTLWRVEFMGFAPGFGYLVPHTFSDIDLHPDDETTHPFAHLPRRDESRPRVPAGSVAVAANYSAVYPRESPGGWHLLGHTVVKTWDIDRTPPATLTPGRLVRFVDIGEVR